MDAMSDTARGTIALTEVKSGKRIFFAMRHIVTFYGNADNTSSVWVHGGDVFNVMESEVEIVALWNGKNEVQAKRYRGLR